ncbi:MAG TPA: sensor domain-containing diguanylate cyclase [Deltaproteobacteria bacterium]|nr:sensor domain-containing diguanylate cyclase [Deltaproteobacteria bacterium]
MIFSQIFDMVDIGLVVIDAELKVLHWNRWMELRSGIAADRIRGASIVESFPELNTPRFLRSCKSVLSFGNFCFFSQKLHGYLFPFKPVSAFESDFDHMQQSCTMGPLRDEDGSVAYLYIAVHDVTEIVAYEKRLIEMNVRDALTGAYNRRFLETKLEEEFERTSRYQRPFSIILFDIDFFKSVNDEYGHVCGDVVLKTLVSTVASMIRKTDFLARYGGEEFCCLLPETPFESARVLADRIRKRVEEMEIIYEGKPVKVTISLGVTAMSEKAESPRAMLLKADEALYEAKRLGRNRQQASL